MSQEQKRTSEFLKLSASGLAAMITEQMIERSPQLGARYGSAAFRLWKDHLQRRIQELACSLEEAEPASFRRHMEWARTSFEARDVPLTDLQLSLECLRNVLEQELPARSGFLAPYFEDAAAALEGPATEPVCRLNDKSPQSLLAARFLQSLLSGNRQEASGLVQKAVDTEEITFREALLEVLLPAEVEVGRMWLLNEVSVAEEHFVTSTTRMVMAQLAAGADRRAPAGLALLTAAVEGNRHDLGISAMGYLFEAEGWRVIHLGPDVPHEDLAQAVLDFRPDVIALSATLDPQRQAMRAAIECIRSAEPPYTKEVKILVGGPALENSETLWKDFGANAFSRTIEESLSQVFELVRPA
jgi:methanogenic corrinoid protein MtbC1